MRQIIISVVILFLLLPFSFLCAKDVENDRKLLYIDEQIRFADGLVSRGHYDLAIEEYIRLTKKFSDDPLAAEAWIQLAEAYAAKKDFKSSLETFNIFFKKFPNIRIIPAARLKYALILYQTKIAENRKKAFDILLKLKTDKHTPSVVQDAASFHLGRLYLAENKSTKALDEFRELAAKKIEISPEHDFRASALLELVEQLKKSGKTDDAIKLLAPVVEHSANLRPAVSAGLYRALGGLYSENHDYGKAADIFAQFAILFPDSPYMKRVLYQRLHALYMQKEYRKVVTEADHIIADNKADYEDWERFYLIKSSALSGMKFYEKALEPLIFVLKNSKNGQLLGFAAYKYVKNLIDDGDIARATESAENYISDPRLPGDVVKDITMLITDSVSREKAEELLRKALTAVDPDSENSGLLQLRLAAMLLRGGHIDAAMKIYTAVGAGYHKALLPYAVMGEGRCFEQLKEDDKALAKYKYLLKTFPDSALYPEAMLRTAVIMLKNRDQWGTVKIYLTELVTRFPDSQAALTALFYQGYMAFYNKEFEIAEKILISLLQKKDISADLKQDATLYLLWSQLKLKKYKPFFALFDSLRNPEKIVQRGETAFINELGNALTEHDPDAARICFKELVRRGDEHNLQLGYLGLARVDIQAGDPVKAINLLREASDIDFSTETGAAAMMLLGELLVKRGRDDEAVMVYQKCLENPVNKEVSAGARLGLARILSRKDDRLKTASRYAMSVFILSDDKDICSAAMLLSIEISLKLKDKKSAEATWNELAQRFPDVAESDKAKQLKKEIMKK